jgi:hypothetical protein
MTVDRDRLRLLLTEQAVRFCRAPEPLAIMRRGVTYDDRAPLRAMLQVVPGRRHGAGEVVVFAAIALALVDDDAGLDVLRDPHAVWMTNSAVEVALAQCARLLLGDVQAPMRFINAAMLGPLAVLVGAMPPT